MLDKWPGRLGALAGYCLLTALFCSPMASRLSTHIIGPSGGESCVGLWSMWYFRHAITVLGSNPFWSDHQYWPYGSNLILHNYTPLNGWLGYLLQGAFNIEATYNLLFMSYFALAGWFLYLMLRDWDMGPLPAFAGGALYAFSPLMDHEIIHGGGIDRIAIHGLPLFLWTFSRAIRGGKFMDSFWAALALTLVWTYHYKYFLFCSLLIPFFFICLRKPIAVGLAPRPSSRFIKTAARLCEMGLLFCLWKAGQSVWRGQIAFHGSGSARDILIYVAPYLGVWGVLGLRLALHFKPQFGLNRAAFGWGSLRPYAWTSLCWLILNLPMVVSVVFFMASGDYGGPEKAWRSGGGALNPIWMFLPKLTHPVWGEWMSRLDRLPFLGPPESISLGLVPLACAFWLWRRRPNDPWISLWFAGLAFSFIITLGPWLRIGSLETYLPLPFYFLHLLPIFSNMQSGDKINVFITLFLAILFAASLREIQKTGNRRARPALLAIAALLCFELAPKKRDHYRLAFPALFSRLADRPAGAMLTLPTGAVFDALGPEGAIGETLTSITAQTVHQKPIVGGFLGRVSRRVYDTMRKDGFWMALVAAQSGRAVEPALADKRRVARYAKEMGLKYLLIDTARIPEALEEAVKTWPVGLIDEEGGLRLYSFNP